MAEKRNHKPTMQIGLVGTYLMVFAISGWLILVANLFGIAGRSGWVFPEVADLQGLFLSMLVILILAVTPMMLKSFIRAKDSKS